MCTVTLIAGGAPGVRARLVCNRDEQRVRTPGLPPRRVVLGGRSAVLPIDPESGGTWIGVNDAGLVACLLNSTPAGLRLARARESRGGIVPRLLACGDLVVAASDAADVEAERYPPFRVMLLDGERFVLAESDGASVRVTRAMEVREAGPIVLTSSGLGDALVDGPRCELFESMVRAAAIGAQSGAQDQFHSHTWPERPHLSVQMSRADARTVSRTVVEMREGSVSLAYTPLDEQMMPMESARLTVALGAAMEQAA